MFTKIKYDYNERVEAIRRRNQHYYTKNRKINMDEMKPSRRRRKGRTLEQAKREAKGKKKKQTVFGREYVRQQ